MKLEAAKLFATALNGAISRAENAGSVEVNVVDLSAGIDDAARAELVQAIADAKAAQQDQG